MSSVFEWAWLDPGPDLVADAIAALFPAWTLSGTSDIGAASTVLSTLIGRLSAIGCQVMLAYLVYGAFAKTVSAAESATLREGRGNWIAPLRIAVTALMLIPLPSGYCGGQMLVSSIARAAIGLGANFAREAQTQVGPAAQPIVEPMIPGTKRTVAALIQVELCRALINAAANNDRIIPAPQPVSGTSRDGYGYVTWSYDLSVGNATGAPVCGSVTVRTQSGATISAGTADVSGAQRAALQAVLEGTIRPGVTAVARELWERRTVSSLAGLQRVFVSASSAYTGRLKEQATTMMAQLRARYTADEMRRGTVGGTAGMNQMQDFGFSGLGAYYASFARLNGSTLSLLSATPVITSPSYQGLGRYLSLDLAPLVQAAQAFGDRLNAYVAVNDVIDAPAGGADIFGGATPEAQGAGALEQALRKIDFTEHVLRFFVKNLAPSATAFGDPFSALMRLGNDMASIALIGLGAAALLSSTPAATGLAAYNLLTFNFAGTAATITGHTMMQFLGQPVFYMLMAVLIPGLTLAFVVPMVPVILWTMGILGWMIRVFEAMVAVPLWALAHATFSGEGMHGRGLRGWGNVLAIFLTPALMVIGLFGSYWLFAWISRLIFLTFFVAAQSTLVQGWLVANLAGVVVLLAMFVLLHIVAAVQCFQLITLVAAHLPGWIGLDSPDRVNTHSLAQDAGMVGMGATLAAIRGGAVQLQPSRNDRNDDGGGDAALQPPAKQLGMDRAVAAAADTGGSSADRPRS